MNRYSTVNELVEREIVAALGEHADDHDIEAIERHMLDNDMIVWDPSWQAFHLAIESDVVWQVIELFAKS